MEVDGNLLACHNGDRGRRHRWHAHGHWGEAAFLRVDAVLARLDAVERKPPVLIRRRLRRRADRDLIGSTGWPRRKQQDMGAGNRRVGFICRDTAGNAARARGSCRLAEGKGEDDTDE